MSSSHTLGLAVVLTLAAFCPGVSAPAALAQADRQQDEGASSAESEARQSPVRQRSQRVERLRQLGGELFESLAGGEAADVQIDVDRLNQGIEALLEPVLAGDNALEYFDFGFDPRATDFGDNSIKFFLSAGLTHTAWSPAPTTIDLDVLADIRRPSRGPARAALDADLRVRTEVVPLANYVLSRAAERLYSDQAAIPAELEAQAATPHESADERFRRMVADKLARTGEITSMDDLADLFVYLSGLRLASINDHIDWLKIELTSAQDEQAREQLLADLARARRQRDFLFNVRPSIERDERGQAVAIHVRIADATMDDDAQVRFLDLVVSAGEISLSAEAQMSKGVNAYLLMKPIVLRSLEGIQNRDTATIGLGQGILARTLGEARQFFLGEPAPAE